MRSLTHLSSTTQRRSTWLACALSLGALSMGLLPACSRRAPSEPGALESEETLAITSGAHDGDGAAGDVGEDLTTRYWVAGCSVSEDLWRYRKSSTVTCDERGRFLEGSQGVLVWPDYLEADEIDTLVVEGEQLAGLRLELSWSDGDSFREGRSVTPDSASSTSDRIRFDLARAPEWQGRIRRFRLTWSGAPSSATRVLGARGIKRAPGLE